MLADRLHELGGEPVLIPALEIVPPLSYAALDSEILRLCSAASFDWLLFTSANAVESFARRVHVLRVGGLPPSLRVAVIGAATERALRTTRLVGPNDAVLTPPQAVAESLLASLLPYARKLDGTPTRFLLIRAEEARELLPEGLRAAGGEVTVAPAYRTVVPQGSVGALRELFTALPAVDAICFTSSSSVRNLLALCEAAEVKLPASALRCSIGPITSATLQELGLPANAEAPEATVHSLAAAVMKALS